MGIVVPERKLVAADCDLCRFEVKSGVGFLVSLLQSRRFWGLTGTAVAMYFLFFVVLGKLDMSWIMPDTTKIARAVIEVWPHMPFFAAQKAPGRDSDPNVIYYTVPTRQFTPQELARMGVTNHVAQPARPKK